MALDKQENTKKVFSELVNRINEDRRRIRLMEQNIDRLEESINSTESDLLARISEFRILIERMERKLSETTTRMVSLEAEISRLDNSVKKAASKIDLKQLENFIDLVNPITSKFVTKEELERAIEERLLKEAAS